MTGLLMETQCFYRYCYVGFGSFFQNCNEVPCIFGYSAEFDFYVEFCLMEFKTDWRYFDT